MYVFWSCKRAQNLHTYANVNFPLISSKIGKKRNIFVLNQKINFNHSHFITNTTLRIELHTYMILRKYWYSVTIMHKFILMLPCNTLKLCVLSRKHEKRSLKHWFPTKIKSFNPENFGALKTLRINRSLP